VELQDLSRHLKKAWAVKQDGPVVGRVYPGSPAETAGIQVGDILLRLGDWAPPAEADTQSADLADRVAWHRPGTQVSLKALRGARERDATITLGGAPKPLIDAERVKLPRWGLELAELTRDVRDALLLRQERQGVVAYKVEDNTEASISGLKHLDLILEVNGTPVATPQGARDLLSKGKTPHRLLVERRGLTRLLLLGAKVGPESREARAQDSVD